MKTVHKLNKNEIEELKSNYFYELLDTDPNKLEGIEFSEDIPTEDIIAHYEGINFVEDDFFCNI